MKQHLNTLFVTTEGAYVAKQGETAAVRIDRKVKLRIPLHNLDGLVCFGRVACSPQLLAACAKAGITVSLLDPHGRFRAAVVGFSPGNVLLRREQYRWADDECRSLSIARNIVAAKSANSRSVLLRSARESKDNSVAEELRRATRRLGEQISTLDQVRSLDSLRGIEGDVAKTYFGCFPHLISAPGFTFTGRNRQPPRDAVNALLSFLYSLLAHDIRSACEAAGLDAAVGYLHTERPGRPSLALDLMEEFRAFLADRLALSLINRRQLSIDDFITTESGAVQMSDSARKQVIASYQKRKQATMLHPFLSEKATVGFFPHLQARILARHIRGDLDAYPAFIWK